MVLGAILDVFGIIVGAPRDVWVGPRGSFGCPREASMIVKVSLARFRRGLSEALARLSRSEMF